MTNVIEEFWIIDRYGICFFHRSINPEDNSIEKNGRILIDDQLFSGFLSGLMSFASKMTSSQIEQIKMEGAKFLFFSHQNLIFIVKSQLNSEDSKIKKKIEIIEKLFIKKFQKELESFDGEINSFQIFEKDLEYIFKRMTKSEKWAKGLLEL